ncbi:MULTISPECIES: signal peptidase II [Plesiomonas]|uniref:signal peptidase II n=1 Tax=Plesiomonas TaxID=702 RepID=UPI0012616863|nr:MULTISPECIES: signal peptidase II [Plesiomonas]KAB7689066.1 lipoprotein signal peptidase [Plesiomonas shigelloides]MCE5162698.1 signal peptidase II [Plesiomonas sp. PI-19]MCQ8858957.1 signal peptidase II [Plesiomonas shigelloides]
MKKPLLSTGLRWLWLSALVFVLDIGSKLWFMNHLALYELIPVTSFFNLTYVQNPGAAFSFLAEHSGWQRWFFAAIALLVTGALSVWMYRTPASHKLANGAYALIIGGALGNLFDRLVHGFVVDFLDFYWGSYHWPAFNLADVAICVGAALVVLEGFLAPTDDSASSGKSDQAR